ncbi:MAG TPA: SAF domain-containing protein [Acidimicrobiales bacterium]|nr:SAF domain-containing protein [Acidimicrobiales bacterium]
MYRIRLLFARRPWLYWAVVAVVCLLVTMAVTAMVRHATASARSLGRLVAVPVAARPLALGAVVGEEDVSWREVPAGVLPGAPVEPSPVGRTVVVPVLDGEVLLAAKFAPAGLSGVAALLPAGARALAVPVVAANPSVQRGDRVDLLADSEVIAADAVVLDVNDEVVTIAVVADEAPRVAHALSTGVVTLSLASPYE